LSLAPLPNGLTSLDDGLHDKHLFDSSGTDGDWTDADIVQSDDSHKEKSGADDPGYDGKSVTLREILLQAGDATEFDLLAGYEFNIEDESTVWE